MVKTLVFSIFLITVVFTGIAQVPDAFNYQAVVRNNSGDIVATQNVSFRISILQNSADGTATYVETHSASTNNFGLVNLKIGKGTMVSGSFNPANWGSTDHFMKIEIDAAGGSSYAHLGTTQLLAVPYAFHAQTVENDEVNDADAGNELQTMSLSGTQLTLYDGGSTVTLPSSGGGDNWGTETVKSDATLNGKGTTADPLTVVGELGDDQKLFVTGNELTISEGNTVTLPESEHLWKTENSNLYFNAGKVGIAEEVGENRRQFQVTANDVQAISGENNSTYPTLYLKNNGSGPAADFRNTLRIEDGTQGAGKVLTSDIEGLTSWQTPVTASSLWTASGSNIY